MERTNDKSIELTAKELDTVTGGRAAPLPPRNPYPWPTDPKWPTR